MVILYHLLRERNDIVSCLSHYILGSPFNSSLTYILTENNSLVNSSMSYFQPTQSLSLLAPPTLSRWDIHDPRSHLQLIYDEAEAWSQMQNTGLDEAQGSFHFSHSWILWNLLIKGYSRHPRILDYWRLLHSISSDTMSPTPTPNLCFPAILIFSSSN